MYHACDYMWTITWTDNIINCSGLVMQQKLLGINQKPSAFV